jgi:predicted acylesterase/phospholipase RssA
MNLKMGTKKGLVVSGGGAWGAFGAGTIAALNKDYDIAAGISTGALMTPLAVLGEWDRLKEAYTSVKDKDIFDLRWYLPRPIKKNGKVNIWAVILALLLRQSTFGTTKNMRKLIDKFVHYTDYDKIHSKNKEVLVGCQNMAELPSLLHYFTTNAEEFEDFKDWMWASANAAFATSLISKEWGENPVGVKYMGQWTDGGLTEVIPLKPVIDSGCDEIDVIIHRPQPTYIYEIDKVENLIDNVERSIAAMRFDIEFEHLIETCERTAKKNNAEITLYYLPRKLTRNSLVFNKNEMLNWWEEGYNTVNNEDRIIRFKP